jgi:hypothetical protein
MRQLQRLAFLHPTWTLVVVAIAVLAKLSSLADDPRVVSASLVLLALAGMVPVGWAYGIHRTATRLEAARDSRPRLKSGRPFFVAAAGMLVFNLLAPFEREGSTWLAIVPPVVVFYILAFWLAAAALARFQSAGPADIASTFKTFVLMHFWIVGAWLLSPTLKRLREAAEQDI